MWDRVDLERLRRSRLTWVGGGAAATVLALDAIMFLIFLAWASTWRPSDPACESVTIGDCVTLGDVSGWVIGAVAILMVIGLPVSLAVIVSVLSIVKGVTRWMPGRGSGTALALALGTVSAIAGPTLVAVLLSALIALGTLA